MPTSVYTGRMSTMLTALCAGYFPAISCQALTQIERAFAAFAKVLYFDARTQQELNQLLAESESSHLESPNVSVRWRSPRCTPSIITTHFRCEQRIELSAQRYEVCFFHKHRLSRPN
jgi:hypothetical protein